jgi:hypothetical protein
VDNIALWLGSLAHELIAPSTISTYLSAVKRAVIGKSLQADPEESLSSSPILKEILEGYARTYDPPVPEGKSPPKSISAPFTLEQFRRVYDSFKASLQGRDPSPFNRLLLAAVSLGLGGCLRPGEYLRTNESQRPESILSISQLFFTVSNIVNGVTANHELTWTQLSQRAAIRPPPYPWAVKSITLHLRCGKTDQRRRGHDVIIDDPLCVQLIIDYLLKVRIDTFMGDPIEVLLFEPTRLIPIHYSALRMSKHFRQFLSSNGVPNPQDFTLKSLRSGAAQSLFDAGASSIAIQALGRWSNPNTPVGSYLNRPTQSRPTRG